MGGMGGMAFGGGLGMQQQALSAHAPNEFRVMVRTEERGTPIPIVDDLRSHFSMFGQVTDVHTTPRQNDMAFVSFADLGSLQSVLQDPHPVVAGVQCNVREA